MDKNAAINFVIQNARPLELAVYKYFFENGSNQAVINELSKMSGHLRVLPQNKPGFGLVCLQIPFGGSGVNSCPVSLVSKASIKISSQSFSVDGSTV